MLKEAHRRGGRAQQTPAFTLVELLVVVSVVALLLGMLLPSLRAARSEAKRVVCTARLQQWAVAFACYAADNRGFWPHCDGLDREDVPDPANPDCYPPNAPPWRIANWHGWADVLPPLVSGTPWRRFASGQHPQAGTFYQCPSARLSVGDAQRLHAQHCLDYKPWKVGYFSYAMNSCLELDESTWIPPGGSDWPMPSFLNTERIVGPQRVVLLFDQLVCSPTKGYGGDQLYRSAGRYSGSYPIAFAARHARNRSKLGGNILFCDGHADWRRTVWKPEWTNWDVAHQQGPPREDPDWYPYPAPGGGRR